MAKLTESEGVKTICVAGAGGFIGSHLARKLKSEGHWVRAADWKENEYMQQEEFCDEFIKVDLRDVENCKLAVAGCDWVFNLAADMGGMGFIQSNHSRILYNSTMISLNMAEAARLAGVKRFWFASSACIYPEFKQLKEDVVALKEDDAWPAQPQDAYGLEKLVTEELLMHYMSDFGMECRIGRFHNIYGPQGTWKGGREKAPAAFCRKALTATTEFEMWGNGKQTRSFCYVDDAVEVGCARPCAARSAGRLTRGALPPSPPPPRPRNDVGAARAGHHPPHGLGLPQAAQHRLGRDGHHEPDGGARPLL